MLRPILLSPQRLSPLLLRPLLVGIGLCALALPSCASPSVTGEVKGEPVCADFQLGGADGLMKGSLRRPVQLSVMDGDDVRWQRVLLGRRHESDPVSKFVVEDDDGTYAIRWAQCANVFAPKRDDDVKGPPQMGAGYNCGEATVYKEVELKVVAGDPASRVIEWQPPPDTTCWSASAAPDPSVTASASAAPSASAPPSASVDAGAAASASATATGSATAAATAPPPAPNPPPSGAKPAAPAVPAPPPPTPAATATP